MVLTKIDLYLKKFVAKNSKNFNDKDLSCLRYNSKELFNNPEVIRLMREAKNLYQVDSIFPFVNYTVPTLKNGKEARNLHVDYLGLAILRDSTKKAQENILNSQTLLRLRHKSDAYHHFNDNENINDEDLQEEEDTKNLKKDYEILVRIPTINESTTIQESVDLFESQIEIGSGSKLVKQGKSELYTSMNYSDKDFIPYIEDEFTPEMIAKLGDKEFNLLIYKNSMDEPIGVVPNVKEKTTLKLLKEKIETYVVCPNNFYFAKKQAWKTTPDGSKEMIKTGLDKLMVKDIFHSEGNWERERDGYNVVIYFDDPKIEFKIITELNQKAIDAGKYAKLVNDDKNFGAILKKSQSLKEIQDIVSQALGNDYSLVKCKKFKENIKPIIFTLDELTSTTLEKFKKSDTWYKDEKTKGDIILIYPKAKGN